MNLSPDEIFHVLATKAGSEPLLFADLQGVVLAASEGAQRLPGSRISGPGLDWTFGVEAIGGWRGPPASSLTKVRSASGDRTWTLEVLRFPLTGPAQAYALRLLGDVSVAPPPPSSGPGERRAIGAPEDLPGATSRFGLWTRSSAMLRVFQIIERAADSETTVLVRGESGSGKEHVARALHDLSRRSAAPYVAVNCAALTPSLLESELFGHIKGAFTGAVRDRVGLFEQAHRGTIFLDEIAELPLELQSKLLRVLEERVVTPVGSTLRRPVDVRVISATHQSLRHAVAMRRFRDDLMYRLRVVPIFLPPLRERDGDVELLMRVILRSPAISARRRFEFIDGEAFDALLAYPWPGNVRELHNALEYASVVAQGESLTVEDLPLEFREAQPPRPIQRYELLPDEAPAELDERSRLQEPGGTISNAHRSIDEQAEREMLRRVLASCGGHKNEAAEQLGIHRTTLWRKLKQYGLA